MTLTPRQTEILQLIADGKTAAQIAFAFNTSDQTIKNQLMSIRRLLGALNSTQAVAIGIRKGLIK